MFAQVQLFDTSYRPEEKFEQAIIETVPAQYLYQMDDTAYFMNTETYDQYEIPVANVQEELKFILENSEVKINSTEQKLSVCKYQQLLN